MKSFIVNLGTLVVTILVLIAGAEATLRFLPVVEDLGVVAVNESQPLFHFTPSRTFTWSRGWDFSIVTQRRVNNVGYVDDRDVSADGAPLLAVIGDSYVEATMVPYAETAYGRLAAASGTCARVHGIGASGAPLSQYLIFAQYAAKSLRAKSLVIVVVGNDFDESLALYKMGPGFHHYHTGADGNLKLVRNDYSPGKLGRIIVRSALARYMLFNMEILALPARIRTRLMLPPPQYVGNTAASGNDERFSLSIDAIQAFFRDLPRYTGLPPENILFVIDGFRYPVQSADESIQREASYFGRMRREFMALAIRSGHEVINADDLFLPHIARHPDDRMEFPTDGHWNGIAHGLVANAVGSSRLYANMVEPTCPGTAS